MSVAELISTLQKLVRNGEASKDDTVIVSHEEGELEVSAVWPETRGRPWQRETMVVIGKD